MTEHPPHGLAAPYPPDGRVGSAPATAAARPVEIASRAVGLAIDVAKSALITLLVFAVACGVLSVFLTTSVGHELVEGRTAHGPGPYAAIFGEAASLIAPLCGFALLGSLFVFTARRKAGRPASVRRPLIVGLVLVGASWGYFFYAEHGANADEDREYAAAVALKERQNGELAALFAAYQKEQVAAQLDRVVELGNGGSKEAIGLARQRLAALGSAVTALKRDFDGAQARFRHEIEGLAIVDRHKRKLLEGFDVTARKRTTRVQAFCFAERALIAAANDIVAFAAARPGAARGPTSELERLLERLRAAADNERKAVEALQVAS